MALHYITQGKHIRIVSSNGSMGELAVSEKAFNTSICNYCISWIMCN